eukprot:scpid67079/ scgid15903/ 
MQCIVIKLIDTADSGDSCSAAAVIHAVIVMASNCFRWLSSTQPPRCVCVLATYGRFVLLLYLLRGDLCGVLLIVLVAIVLLTSYSSFYGDHTRGCAFSPGIHIYIGDLQLHARDARRGTSTDHVALLLGMSGSGLTG